jgi:hypothetical protein
MVALLPVLVPLQAAVPRVVLRPPGEALLPGVLLRLRGLLHRL